MTAITPELVLQAYMIGYFPMAEGRGEEEIFWVDPDNRGVLPFDQFHIPKSLQKTIKQRVFEVRCDQRFEDVVRLCAEPTPKRPDTWINPKIFELYMDLHRLGYAHSVEAYSEGELVGGLYGVALQGAFFGESMFSRAADASKTALVHLVARLKNSGFLLLDTQFVTKHLEKFGAKEIPREEYRVLLERALQVPAKFDAGPDPEDQSVLGFLQSITLKS
ncbi:MAG: leucyl/phenylalanyl-tRNA--protein transferase [Dongiaceae bacterium]